MSYKDVGFYLGCVVAWFFLLPVLVVSGSIALVVYAVFSQVGEYFVGASDNSIDTSAARETARRLCAGH